MIDPTHIKLQIDENVLITYGPVSCALKPIPVAPHSHATAAEPVAITAVSEMRTKRVHCQCTQRIRTKTNFLLVTFKIAV